MYFGDDIKLEDFEQDDIELEDFEQDDIELEDFVQHSDDEQDDGEGYETLKDPDKTQRFNLTSLKDPDKTQSKPNTDNLMNNSHETNLLSNTEQANFDSSNKFGSSIENSSIRSGPYDSDLKERFDSGGKLAFRRCLIFLADHSFDEYLKNMVLQNQKQIRKDLKIIIFDFFREYLRPLCRLFPELENEFRPLSRDEKRSIKLIDERLFSIKEIIVYHFEYHKKETLIPIIEKYYQSVLMNHKRKDIKEAKKILDIINSMKNNG